MNYGWPDSEDEDIMILWNIVNYLLNGTIQSERIASSATQLWATQILRCLLGVDEIISSASYRRTEDYFQSLKY